MDDREKLADLMIELKGYLEEIYEFPTLDFFLKELAMQLIANGVTFATDNNDGSKWISVTERLPEENGTYIVSAFDGHDGRTSFAKWQNRFKTWNLTGARSYWKVTHWMPLPEPPEGD